MKRSSSPVDDDSPAQKCHVDEIMLEFLRNEGKQFYKRLHTSGKVIWSGTVEIPDLIQNKVFDSSVKVLPQDEGIKSSFPLRQLTMGFLPSSVAESLSPYRIQSRRLILCKDENTDMMSYSAFSQAIRLYSITGRCMFGCTVLKSTASALHLLSVYSFSSEHEDYIEGFTETYQANDAVLGILRSHGLLPYVNPEHGLAKLKEELQDKDKMLNEQQRLNQEQMQIHKKKMAEKEEELVRLHQEVEEQKKLAEKKQEELATSQNERGMMKEAIKEKTQEIIVKDITMMENDETLKRKDKELLSLQENILELQNKKEQVEEQLHRVLIMKDRRWDAEREMNTEEDTDKTLMMETFRLELENEVTMKQAALDEIDRMMENDFKCIICSQLFIKTTTLNCSHSFCAFCIQEWLSKNGTCPHCRTGVTASVRSKVLDNLIETIIDKLGDEAKERRKVTVMEREDDISTQEGGHLCSIPEDVETDDETSTVSSPCSSLSHLSPSASFMSPCSCPPSSASTWSRSPASIASMFSPPSALSTNSPSPACNGSNN